MKSRLISIGEMARILEVHPATLARLDKRGDFKAQKNAVGWRSYKESDIPKLRKVLAK